MTDVEHIMANRVVETIKKHYDGDIRILDPIVNITGWEEGYDVLIMFECLMLSRLNNENIEYPTFRIRLDHPDLLRDVEDFVIGAEKRASCKSVRHN